jgi:hypothetical protein
MVALEGIARVIGKKRERDRDGRALFRRGSRRYGVLPLVPLAESARRMLSRRMLSARATESIAAGAGAIAGVVVSVAGVSAFEHAASTTIAAARAMRFMFLSW